MKKINALRWCAILTLSALFLAGAAAFISPNSSATNTTAQEIRHNISSSPKPTKIRILGSSIFTFAIFTTIIVLSREIRSSRPQKEQILRKYYRS